MKSLLNIRPFAIFVAIMFLNVVVDIGHKITIQNLLIKSFDGPKLLFLTALVNLLIILPYIGLFSTSGYLNDRFSRTKITRYCSVLQTIFIFFITIFYIRGWFYVAFATTLLLGIQSAIYSPAKYGLIRRIVGAKNLGMANGIVQALTIIAILISSFFFSTVFEQYYIGSDIVSNLQAVWIIGAILFALAFLQVLLSFLLPIYNAAAIDSKFDKNRYFKFDYFKENISFAKQENVVLLSIVGLAIFWGISLLCIVVFPAHYKMIELSDNVVVIQLITALTAVGIVLGSLFAGNLSKNHIEVGLTPFGAIGLGLALLIVALSNSIFSMMLAAFLFGFAGGIFVVPLEANIQFFSKESIMGRVIASSNFIQNLFMVAFLLFALLCASFDISTRAIFIIAAICVFVCGFYGIKLLPHLFARVLTLPFIKLGYKVYVDGVQNIPLRGGVLLLGNHVSFIDWLVLQIACPRPIKFAMHRSYYSLWYLKWFLKWFKTIPIDDDASKIGVEKIREYLQNGEVVALFPEGHLSYNGQVDEFMEGFEVSLKDSGAFVVPFYISGLWGSTFSRANTKSKSVFYTRRQIGVNFGKAMSDSATAKDVKKEVVALSFFAFEEELRNTAPLQYNWLKTVKRNPFRNLIADTTGLELNGIKFLTLMLVFLKKIDLGGDKNIGLLLPSSVMGSAMNLLVLIKGRVGVNLNYTLSEENLINCVEMAGIKKVISSKKFVEKLKDRGFYLERSIGEKFIYLEDIGATVTKNDRKMAFLKALFFPKALIKALYFEKTSINDEACILFSSGSESLPKGVILTHKNIMANILQIYTLLNSDDKEVILANLPTFHCFGLTVSAYLPLSTGIKSVHVPDPTDGYMVGLMSAKHRATVMFGTSTFYRLYTKNRKVNSLMFSNIRVAISGAEKLNLNVRTEFKMKFGVDIYEGYGTTETTPVISVNTPNILEPDNYKELIFSKLGSVGLPLPFTIVKIVDEESLEELKTGEEGLILIGGAQVMKGYYKDEKRTAKVLVNIDGVTYYKTGDIGYIDKDGFLFITDRVSRFAKVGGEMISLGLIEGKINELLDQDEIIAITNVPDEKKGESIVLFYVGDKDKIELNDLLDKSQLPPIMRPSKIHLVESIPTLGSGKTDLGATKKLALELEER